MKRHLVVKYDSERRVLVDIHTKLPAAVPPGVVAAVSLVTQMLGPCDLWLEIRQKGTDNGEEHKDN